MATETTVIYGLPRWAWMWLLAAALFGLFKGITWRGATKGTAAAPTWRSIAYLVGWVGLDPGPFLIPREAPPRPRPREWLVAGFETAFGACLLWLVLPRLGGVPDPLVAWFGLVGLAFLLHFGLFHLLALVWRLAGVAARPIMDAPLAAASVAEFWGRRWNLAFRDLSHRFLFRPVRRRHGAVAALLAVFLGSGLVHDLVISLPAGGGWGLPTLYFALQGAAVLGERRWRRRLAPGGPAGRLLTVAVVALPAPLLFHPPFLRHVALPFLAAIGAFWQT